MSGESEAPVLRDLDDGVLLLTLNRPTKKNAFNDPQWDALRDALNEAREDDDVCVVVVTGAGADFSAGQDLTAFGGARAPREDGRQSGYYGCMDALFAFDKPLIAAAKGVGVGIGATIRVRLVARSEPTGCWAISRAFASAASSSPPSG